MNVLYYILFVVLTIYIISFKTIEGFDDEFYNYKTLPNSYIYNSNKSKHNDMFYFYKGKGSYKKEKTKRDIEGDKKISTLNKLLDRLLGKILSDEQDCVGSFGKYSECDKQCGLGGNQTRKYTITQERGENGQACPQEDGYEEKIPCFIDECQLGELCENDRDCDTRNCEKNSKRCGERIECDKDNLSSCNQDQCRQLNEEYGTEEHLYKGKYLYELNSGSCFFKTPAEVEEMTVNLYTYNFENPDIEEVSNEDCAYYQEIRNNECVNKDNIILGSDNNPKCSPGRSPQPNAFNMDHACSECGINDSDNFREDGDGNCQCSEGYFLENGRCVNLTRSVVRAYKKDRNCTDENDITDFNSDSPQQKLSIFRILRGSEGSTVCLPKVYQENTDTTTTCREISGDRAYFDWDGDQKEAKCLPCPSDTKVSSDETYEVSYETLSNFLTDESYRQSCNEYVGSDVSGSDEASSSNTLDSGTLESCQNGNYVDDDGDGVFTCQCFGGYILNNAENGCIELGNTIDCSRDNDCYQNIGLDESTESETGKCNLRNSYLSGGWYRDFSNRVRPFVWRDDENNDQPFNCITDKKVEFVSQRVIPYSLDGGQSYNIRAATDAEFSSAFVKYVRQRETETDLRCGRCRNINITNNINQDSSNIAYTGDEPVYCHLDEEGDDTYDDSYDLSNCTTR